MIRLRFSIVRLSATAAMTAILIIAGGTVRALACPMCFGAEETAMIDGAKLGVLVMVGLVLTVQAAFVTFFLYLRKRAKRIADLDLDTEWAELQKPSRTS
jgi:hypothetical protein